MWRTKLILIVVILFLLYAPVDPLVAGEEGQVPKWTLKQVQEYAVEHSTQTANALLDVRGAKRKIWETTTTGLPQVNASVAYTNNIKIPITLVPAFIFDPSAPPDQFVELQFGTPQSMMVEFKVDQLIFSGSYIVALQASRTYRKLSENTLEKSEIDIKGTVANTYYLILLGEDSLKTLNATYENMKKTLFETREMHNAGFLEDTDVDQLQLTLTDLENSIKKIKREIEITYRLLKYQMGYELDKPISLADSLDNILAGIDAQALLGSSFKLENHIDFRIIKTQERAQQLLMRSEIAAYLPTVSAYLSHTYNAMRDKFNFFNDEKWYASTVLGVRVDIPIFSSGMRSARVGQAKMELRKVRNQRKQAADGLQLEYMQARSEFIDALDKKDNTRKNVELAKRIFEKTQVKYREGMSTSLNLVQIQNQYLTTENNYTRAVVELLNAKIRLDKVLSKL